MARKVSYVPRSGYTRVEFAHRSEHIVVDENGVATSDPGKIFVLDEHELLVRGKGSDPVDLDLEAPEAAEEPASDEAPAEGGEEAS